MHSTSVLSSASKATTSIFDTVANTAVTTTKLINSISTGVNMFDRMMNDMDENHKKRSILNQHIYEGELVENAAREIAKRQNELQKEMKEDANFFKLFETNFKELTLLLNPETTK